ncbi:RRM domain-containing protein [Entamoeba marina]
MSFKLKPCCLTVKKTGQLLHILKCHSSFAELQSSSNELMDNQSFELLFNEQQTKCISTSVLYSMISLHLNKTPITSLQLITILPIVNANDTLLINVTSTLSQDLILQHIYSTCLNYTKAYLTVELHDGDYPFVLAKTPLVTLHFIQDNNLGLNTIQQHIETQCKERKECVKMGYIFTKIYNEIVVNSNAIKLLICIDSLINYFIKSNTKPIEEDYSFNEIINIIKEYLSQPILNNDISIQTELNDISSQFKTSIVTLFGKTHSTSNNSKTVAFAGIPGYVSLFDLTEWLQGTNAKQLLFYQPSFFTANTRKCGVVFVQFESNEQAKLMLTKMHYVKARHVELFDDDIFVHTPSGSIYSDFSSIDWISKDELKVIEPLQKRRVKY